MKLICHKWIVLRNEIYRLVLYMACGEMIFLKKFQILEEKNFIMFYFI